MSLNGLVLDDVKPVLVPVPTPRRRNTITGGVAPFKKTGRGMWAALIFLFTEMFRREYKCSGE